MTGDKLTIPGEAQIRVIRAAVEDGVFKASNRQENRACGNANANRYLDRDRKDTFTWYPTDRGRALLQLLAERERAPAPSGKFTPLPAHPLADLFPMMEDEDIRKLADDICTFGQLHKIITLDGMVLDGRNRQAACLFAEIQPQYEEYTGDDPVNFVISLNEVRRHLTTSQRAMVAAKVAIWQRGINQHTGGSANLPTREAAKLLSVKERAVIKAKRIDAHGVSELSQAVRDGRFSLHAAEELSYLEEEAQREILRLEQREIAERAKALRTERLKHSRAVRTGLIAEIAKRGLNVAGEMPRRAFPILYADPPWQQESWNDETGQDKGLMYPSMPLAEIMALCAGDSSPATPDAKLYLWVPANRLDDGIEVLKAWGFEFVTAIVWDKVHIGMGREVRDRTEFLLIGKRGSFPGEIPGTQPESLYAEVKGPHSRKPVWFAEMIDRLYPDLPKLELFQRAESLQPGDIRLHGKWSFWGFEAHAPAESEVA